MSAEHVPTCGWSAELLWLRFGAGPGMVPARAPIQRYYLTPLFCHDRELSRIHHLSKVTLTQMGHVPQPPSCTCLNVVCKYFHYSTLPTVYSPAPAAGHRALALVSWLTFFRTGRPANVAAESTVQ